MLKRFNLGIIVLLAMMMPLIASGHSNFSSTSYIGEDDVIDNGGGSISSAGYNGQASAGQTAQGMATSTSFILNAGFLHPLPTPTFTPTITPTFTITPTCTVSETSTATPIATMTATPTVTVSATQSATFTVSPTSTISATYTSTATQTITPTKQHWHGDDIICYPQPGRIGKTFRFQININQSHSCEVDIHIYNSRGERVGKLDQQCAEGINQISFDTKDMAPGFYFYIVTIDGDRKETRKMVLIK